MKQFIDFGCNVAPAVLKVYYNFVEASLIICEHFDSHASPSTREKLRMGIVM
jgi:hypothetical protein